MSIYKPKIEDHDVELGLGFEKHGEERRGEKRREIARTKGELERKTGEFGIW